MKNKEMVQKLYTQKNSLYHRLFFGFFKYDKGVKTFFEKNVALNPGNKILDAGCGSGLLTKILFESGMELKIKNLGFYAFDITNAMLDIFKHWVSNNNITNISIHQADVLKMEELPDSWDKFDLIVSSAMLEYLDKKEISTAITNFKTRLAQNGKLILIITKKNIVTKYLIEKWWKSNSYKEEEMLKVLKEVGFEHINICRFPARFWYLNIWGFIFEAKLNV